MGCYGGMRGRMWLARVTGRMSLRHSGQQEGPSSPARYDPTIRFQLRKVRRQACARRAVETTPNCQSPPTPTSRVHKTPRTTPPVQQILRLNSPTLIVVMRALPHITASHPLTPPAPSLPRAFAVEGQRLTAVPVRCHDGCSEDKS